MVPCMTGLEHFMVDPARESQQVAEEGIQPAGFENGAVAELVHRVDEETAYGSMDKDKNDRHPPGPRGAGVIRQGSCHEQDAQVTQSLEGALEIAFAVQILHLGGCQRTAIPGDGGASSYAFGKLGEGRFFFQQGSGTVHFLSLAESCLLDFQDNRAIQYQTCRLPIPS